MPHAAHIEDEFAIRRRRMVENQLRFRGIHDEAVLEAMSSVPREKFVPPPIRESAYEDNALAVGFGQTISQPYIVAYMTAQLNLTPECRVLEIGTGTGYQTAVLAHLAKEVCTIERVAELSDRAEKALASLGITNVAYGVGDGSLGWPEFAPYDRILVTAGAPHVPQPLVDQLTDDGVLVVPVGGEMDQTIVRVERRGGRTIDTRTLPCRFVKLIGQEGWEKNAQVPPPAF